MGLSLWYLVQPQPLLVQGEADATRIDMAARVDGCIGQRPVSRGDNVKAGQLLVSIDNPGLRMKLNETEAARARADGSPPTECASCLDLVCCRPPKLGQQTRATVATGGRPRSRKFRQSQKRELSGKAGDRSLWANLETVRRCVAGARLARIRGS